MVGASIIPSSHHREEGWPSEREISRSFREAGVVFRFKGKETKENHPVCAKLRMLRGIY
jgi:hypothetical protein